MVVVNVEVYHMDRFATVLIACLQKFHDLVVDPLLKTNNHVEAVHGVLELLRASFNASVPLDHVQKAVARVQAQVLQLQVMADFVVRGRIEFVNIRSID